MIIFDNVEDASLIDQYWPACSHGSILLTAQSSDLTHRTTTELLIKSFTPAEAASLLQRLLKSPVKNDEALKLAEEVDCLPLLIVHLAGVISEGSYTLSDVLHVLQHRGDETKEILRNGSTKSTTYQYVSTQSSQVQGQHPMNVVWRLAFRSLTPPARNVLNMLSMLSPVNVPEPLFRKDLKDTELQFLGFQDKFR